MSVDRREWLVGKLGSWAVCGTNRGLWGPRFARSTVVLTYPKLIRHIFVLRHKSGVVQAKG